MRLLVDVGNSRAKWQLLDDDRLLYRDAHTHNGATPRDWVGKLWPDLETPQQVVIGNVAGAEVAAELSGWIARHWRLKPVFAVSKAREFGVLNGYDQPERLGVDRWLALIGARTLTRDGCAVIDCGTAATVDALTGAGRHLGGVILPGVRLMHAALYNNTALLEEQQPPDEVVILGRNTRDCIWGGTVHAITAAIDRVTDYMAETAGGGNFLRLLTGGNAPALSRYLQRDYRLEPDLIFHGLRAVADKTAAAPRG